MICIKQLAFAAPLFFLSLHCTAQEPPVPTIRVTARLVQVNCNAYQKKSHTVAAITDASQLRVFEDNKPIEPFTLRRANDLPLTLGVLFDTSGSETGEWDRMKRQTLNFLRQTLRPGDRIFILTFEQRIRQLQAITSADEPLWKLFDRIDSLQSNYGIEVAPRQNVKGGTRLWDAMQYSLEVMKGAQGRRAIVVFTDGDDNASIADTRQVLRAAQDQSIPFFGVNIYSAMTLVQQAVSQAHSLPPDRRFDDLVEQSGGRAFTANSDKAVADRLQEVADILRSQFVVEYRPPDTGSGFHRIRIEPQDKSQEIRAKSGVTR